MDKQAEPDFLNNNREDHWWQELPPYVKQGVNESIEQANKGKFILLDDMKKEVSALFNNNNGHIIESASSFRI